MRKIAVVAFWGGERRYGGLAPYQNVLLWERKLREFKHGLDAIALVSNRAPQESILYLGSLIKFQSDIPSIVLRRDNMNGSYGAWKYAWSLLGDQFDYYYVFEDDYVPATDYWDDKLLFCMEDQGLGYCGACLSFPEYEKHMGHACGLLTEPALAASEVDHKDLHIYDPELQISFGRDILKAGFVLSDYAHKYSVPYYSDGKTREIGNPNGEALIVPGVTCV